LALRPARAAATGDDSRPAVDTVLKSTTWAITGQDRVARKDVSIQNHNGKTLGGLVEAMGGSREQEYDRIGAGYSLRRRPDERLARHIRLALGDAKTILNVGAGSGSYEPSERMVVALEPAMTMIRQRTPEAAPVVRGHAEALPFDLRAFDAALAVLTIHHWHDWRLGVREMMRISRQRIVIFTWDPESEGFWMRDYLPDLLEKDRGRFPSLAAIQEETGPGQLVTVPIPHDCSDGFMGAYWRRPAAYLEPGVRQAISSLAVEGGHQGLARLAADLADGEWSRRYAGVSELEELDLGYRLLVASSAA
jgi:SAM-dependent methyltransferase